MTKMARMEGLTMTFLTQLSSEPNGLTNRYQRQQLCMRTTVKLILLEHFPTAITEHLVHFPNQR